MAAAPIAIIIPTLNAAAPLPGLIAALRGQALAPAEIIVVDSGSTDDTAAVAAELGCRLVRISPGEFSHGRARNRGAASATAELLVFMTQDATPADDTFLGALTAPLAAGQAAAAYARQLPTATVPPTERFARQFNYGVEPQLRGPSTTSASIRDFFFSNAAAAVVHRVFDAEGGFDEQVIVNEDMLFCARLLQAGHAVAYVPEARVRHAHAYTLRQLLGRYFDIGVFISQAPEPIRSAAADPEGRRFVREQVCWLWRSRQRLWLVRAAAEAGVKWLGFQLGRHWHWWPGWVCRACSGHPHYWQRRG